MANKRSKNTTKKRTSGRRNANRKTTAAAKTHSFQTEIILLIILGAAILMTISEFGLGGFIGDAISTYLFGTMGVLAYAFPLFLFIGSVFLIANKGNRFMRKKTLSFFLLCFIICGLAQIITEGYLKSMTLMDYFYRSADYHSGGGIIGGMVCISMISAFGYIGSYVIMIMLLLISLILITQKSFFGFFEKTAYSIRLMISGGKQRYRDAQPERELRKEIRNREKIRKRQERQAARIEELERALAEEDEREEEAPYYVPELLPKKKPENEEPQSKKIKKKRNVTEELTKSLIHGKKKEEDEEVSEEIAEIRAARKQAANKKRIRTEEIKESFADLEQEEFEQVRAPLFKIKRAAAPAPSAQEKEFMNPEYAEGFEQEQVGEEEIPAARRQPQKNPKSSQQEIESGIQNIENEIQQKEAIPARVYHYPPLKLLKRGDGRDHGESDEELQRTAQKLEDIMRNFGVNVTVTNVTCGPTVTQYELQPEMGVKVSRIVALSDDIKLNLATPDIRIEAPIPGKAAVGIEVPNKENSPVMLRDLLQSQEFQNASSNLAFAVGKDIAGKTVVTDIAKMPHLLIAGSTGSGKSVCINTLITSILYKASPDEVKLIMIDPKVVELSVYNGIPHLYIPVVTDPKKAAGALNWAVQEMTRRYNVFAEFSVRKLEEYNHKVEIMQIPEGEQRPEKMPRIVVIVDELADLMMVAPGEVEDAIVRLTQLARAAGIHLVIATQRPSVNVITGLIKANMPSRIAFAVSSGVDSRVILDSNGAEKLLGKGDMLFYPQGYSKPARLQGAFISDEEVSSIVEFLSNKNPAVEYNTNIEEQVNISMALGGGASSGGERDVYFEEAGKFIIEKDKASIGMLQRMFKIGFNRAARIMDQLSDAGVVGPEEGTKPRKILMSESEFETYLEEH